MQKPVQGSRFKVQGCGYHVTVAGYTSSGLRVAGADGLTNDE